MVVGQCFSVFIIGHQGQGIISLSGLHTCMIVLVHIRMVIGLTKKRSLV